MNILVNNKYIFKFFISIFYRYFYIAQMSNGFYVVPKLVEDTSLKRSRIELQDGSSAIKVSETTPADLSPVTNTLGDPSDDAWDGLASNPTIISLLKGIINKAGPATPIITKFYIYNEYTQTVDADTPTTATAGTQVSISGSQMFAILDQTSSDAIVFASQKGSSRTYTFVGEGYYFKLANYANLTAFIQLSTGQEMSIDDYTSDSLATVCRLNGFILDLQ